MENRYQSPTTIRRLHLKTTIKHNRLHQESTFGSRSVSNCGSHHKISHPLLQFPLFSPYYKLTTPIDSRSTPLFLSTTNTIYTPIIESIGTMIGMVICELQQEGINVSSYDTDNSSIMRRSDSFSRMSLFLQFTHLHLHLTS